MTDTLRSKLRPFIEQLVNTLVDEAVITIETSARDRLKAALEPLPVARVPKSGTKQQRAKIRKVVSAMERKPRAKAIVDRDIKPGNITKQTSTAPIAGARRPCGCGIRGPHKRTCTAEELQHAPAPAPRQASPAQQSVLERARARERGVGG